jgi:Glycosyltransferase family 87
MHTSSSNKRDVAIALAFTVVLLLGSILLGVLSGEATGYDFGTLYSAGWMVRHGMGATLYDLREQARTQEILLGRGNANVYYLQPPFEALILSLLAGFSYDTAYLIWGVINICLWIYFLFLIRPYAPRPEQTFRYYTLCFGFFPLWVTLDLGQTSILLLVLYSLAFKNLKQNRDARAGLFLGMGLFRFQLVLPFVLIFLLWRKWKFLGGFIAAGLGCAALSAATVSPKGVVSYVYFMLDVAKNPAHAAYVPITPWAMPNLRGLFDVLLSPRWINPALAICSTFIILSVSFWWRKEEHHTASPGLELAFSTAVVTSVITGFHVHSYDLSLILLPVLLVIGAIKEMDRWLLILSVAIHVYPFAVYLLVTANGGRYLLLYPLLVPLLIVFILKTAFIARELPRSASHVSPVFG